MKHYEINKSDEEWKQQLTQEQYHITRKKCTESPFIYKYRNFKGDGIYHCICCGNELFTSATKYESGTGWPSFWAPSVEENIEEATDTSYYRVRTEVKCSRCGAHLGHVFEDGPEPTNLRYSINSAALDFKPEKQDA